MTVPRRYATQQIFLDDLRHLLETAPLDLCASWPLALQNGLPETETELRALCRSVVGNINKSTGSSFMILKYGLDNKSAWYRCKYSKSSKNGPDCRFNCCGRLKLALEERLRGIKPSVHVRAVMKLHHGCLHYDDKSTPSKNSDPISNSRRKNMTSKVTPRAHFAETTVSSGSLVRRCKKPLCPYYVPSHSGWVFCASCRFNLTSNRRDKKVPNASPFVCYRCKCPGPTPVGGYKSCDSCRSKHAQSDREYKASRKQLSSTVKVGQMPSQLSTLPNFIFTPSPTPSPPDIQLDASNAGDDGADEGYSMPPPAGHEPTQHSLSISEPLSRTNTEGISEKQVST
ncbi:hypothetical protein DL96DRAFT_150599 [Flagelloscypha sp. PMI_526]|nr:hypothetical protein DL96DRAFT_150599 [Flagelloscypha sp. PMI_526]